MAKNNPKFVCTECGAESFRWAGQCPQCKEWNTIVEFKEPKLGPGKNFKSTQGYAGAKESVRKLSQVKLEDVPRINTGNAEFNRVLGGGIVPGSVILLAGTPGAGKSTLTLQPMCEISEQIDSLIVSAEESITQIGLRASRLQLPTDHLNIASENDVLAILTMITELQVKLVVIDSLQAMYHPDVQGSPGGVSQLRECMQC